MKKLFRYISFVSMLLFIGFNTASAQDSSANGNKNQFKHGQGFVDKNGDGYNDNAPDHDGDGIPNSLDPDWQKMQKDKKRHRFIDLDGDGINDNLQGRGDKEKMHNKGQKQMQRAGSAAGDQSTQQHHGGQRQKHGGH